MAEPRDSLIDEIFRDKVRWARAEKQPGVLSLDGFDLFATAYERMRGGIMWERPDATAEEVEKELQRRLDIARQLSERGIYRPVE
jgi:hypothetical protein